jgi:uncharacterized protein YybS (DUF2232 family)
MQENNENKPGERRKSLIRKELVVGIGTTLVFFFSLLFIPIMGFFSSIFTPLPTLLGFYRWGSPEGYRIPMGAALFTWIILSCLGIARMMTYFLEMVLLGFFLGEGMRRQWSVERTIASASLFVFAIGSMLFLLVHGGLSGEFFRNFEESLFVAISETIKQYQDLFSEKHLSEQKIRHLAAIMVRLIPGVALASTLIVAWLNLLVARRFCQLHRLPLPSWQEWSHWRSPEFLVFGVIISGFMLLLPGGVLQILALNGLIVLATIYFFQGLAIVVFYFDRWKIPPFFRGILYFFLLVQQFTTLGMVFMGFFDVWFDFRRLSKKSTSGIEED